MPQQSGPVDTPPQRQQSPPADMVNKQQKIAPADQQLPLRQAAEAKWRACMDAEDVPHDLQDQVIDVLRLGFRAPIHTLAPRMQSAQDTARSLAAGEVQDAIGSAWITAQQAVLPRVGQERLCMSALRQLLHFLARHAGKERAEDGTKSKHGLSLSSKLGKLPKALGGDQPCVQHCRLAGLRLFSAQPDHMPYNCCCSHRDHPDFARGGLLGTRPGSKAGAACSGSVRQVPGGTAGRAAVRAGGPAWQLPAVVEQVRPHPSAAQMTDCVGQLARQMFCTSGVPVCPGPHEASANAPAAAVRSISSARLPCSYTIRPQT